MLVCFVAFFGERSLELFLVKLYILGWIIHPHGRGLKANMKQKYMLYIITAIIIISVVSAAFFYNGNNSNSNHNSQNTISVIDDEGYTTNLASVPQRIISLAPSNTQIAFAIGIGNRVVGVTDYDHYPYDFSAWIAAGNMTSIGGVSTPNKETIASLNPDLILATTLNDPDVVTLRDLGYKVLVLNPNDVNGVFADISMVGKATRRRPKCDNTNKFINQSNQHYRS